MATLKNGSSDIISAPTHPDYNKASPELRKIRDCVEGSQKVKAERYTYLPHPSQIDQNSLEQRVRYTEYLGGAEFDGEPDRARRRLLGKMRISDTAVELPQKVEYLEQNIDGDGLSMPSAIELAASNIAQFKFHLLVADFQGLSDVDLTDLSLADVERLNPRATVKQYSRDNIVNWHFDRVNGVMQLSWVMLLERGSTFDRDKQEHESVESYLILGLDDNGDYYQQKIVYGERGKKEEGEKEYLTVGGSPLKWLPVVIVSDEQVSSNKFPSGMGVIHSVCEMALHKYRVSAVYKEVQRNLPPTTYTSGWKSGDIEIFKDANSGRSYISTGAGAVNNMPADVTVSIESASMEMEDFHWYFDQADKKIKQLGGAQDTADTNKTATEAEINASDQNAMLETLASNLENGFGRIVSYCAMFEGLWPPDAVEDNLDNISIKLPRDFASPRLTVEEVRALMDMRMNRQISEAEFHRQIKNGGWLIAEVDDLLQELQDEGPDLITAPVGQNGGSA